MAFGGAPKAPAPPPPPPMLAQTSPSAAQAQAAAAAAAGNMGFGGTVKTGALGAPKPSTGKQTLGGA